MHLSRNNSGSSATEADCQVTKDTIEGTTLQVIEHINKYQDETIKWYDRKSLIEKYQARSFDTSKDS
jgi:hypothetical protein